MEEIKIRKVKFKRVKFPRVKFILEDLDGKKILEFKDNINKFDEYYKKTVKHFR